MNAFSVLVSIIVPIYNIKEYVSRCIDSIVNQSYKNIEIILVDDGSTDGCANICDFYMQKDCRVKVIHKKNGGLVSARKAGAIAATGDYVLNVDGDDWIEENRVEELVKEIEIARVDMIYMSGYRRDYGDNNILMDKNIEISKKFFSDEDIINQFFPQLFDTSEAFLPKIRLTLWSWAVRRDLYLKNQMLVNEEITMAEDLVCAWLCLLSAKTVKLMEQDGYYYVQREMSLSYKAAMLSENSRSIKLAYYQIENFLTKMRVPLTIRQIFDYMVVSMTLVSNYDLLLKENTEFLYPFSKVKKGHKIVVYGAGKMGCSLINYLSMSKYSEVVIWVDQHKEGCIISGYRIKSIEDIKEVKYDYIVIAVYNAIVAKEIEGILIRKGFNKEKIARMDANVITRAAIPKEVKG